MPLRSPTRHVNVVVELQSAQEDSQSLPVLFRRIIKEDWGNKGYASYQKKIKEQINTED